MTSFARFLHLRDMRRIVFLLIAIVPPAGAILAALLALLLQISIDLIEWAVMPRGLRREAAVKE
jgi:hypothetical protein